MPSSKVVDITPVQQCISVFRIIQVGTALMLTTVLIRAELRHYETYMHEPVGEDGGVGGAVQCKGKRERLLTGFCEGLLDMQQVFSWSWAIVAVNLFYFCCFEAIVGFARIRH